MARFPSGITPLPGADVDDVLIRVAQMMPAMDSQPLGASAPCMNPECASPVDFLGRGPVVLYCSTTCRARAATLRRLAQDQLDLIERTLTQAQHRHGIAREELRTRARQLRWWLTRLATHVERLDLEHHHDDAEGQRGQQQ